MAITVHYTDGKQAKIKPASSFEFIQAERYFKKPLPEIAGFLETSLWLAWNQLGQKGKFENWLKKVASIDGSFVEEDSPLDG